MMHAAIIMDGNRRWAKHRGLSKKEGHKAGAEALEKVIDAALKSEITTLTVFGFSTENWLREKSEIKDLMELLRLLVFSKWRHWRDKDVKLKLIGRRDRVDSLLIASLEEIERDSRDCKSLTLVLALDYGGRDELLRAVVKMRDEGKSMEESLDTAGLADPDLIIRTGGEMRLSNFLLWQSSYSELYFSDKLWPDFGAEDLHLALAEFYRRERRFGACKRKLRATGT